MRCQRRMMRLLLSLPRRVLEKTEQANAHKCDEHSGGDASSNASEFDIQAQLAAAEMDEDTLEPWLDWMKR
eukprot:7312227-Karenia_brevis.AAC.1